VVTSTIVFENDDDREYVGGYDDWQRQRAEPTAAKGDKPTLAKCRPQATSNKTQSSKRRLAYHEKRDLESLPRKIETLETEIGKLHATMADPKFYSRPSNEIAREQKNLKNLTQQLTAAFQRWEELESLAD
jgi:ATP-binding cassette subfamily F protein uup